MKTHLFAFTALLFALLAYSCQKKLSASFDMAKGVYDLQDYEITLVCYSKNNQHVSKTTRTIKVNSTEGKLESESCSFNINP